MSVSNAEIKAEVWEAKFRVFRTAVQEGGLKMDFPTTEERDSFRSYLYNFRAVVTRRKTKYPQEWLVVQKLSLLKRGKLGLWLVITEHMSKNDKFILSINSKI